MTPTKIERKMNELLRQHGDIDLIVYHDRKSGKEVGKYKMSNVPVRNSADFKEVERIIKEGPPRHIKIDVPEQPKTPTP